MANGAKRKVMDIGKKNKSHSYTIFDKKGAPQPLKTTTCEKDLGVHISSNFKSEKHVNSAVSKANSILGQLKNTFASREWATG